MCSVATNHESCVQFVEEGICVLVEGDEGGPDLRLEEAGVQQEGVQVHVGQGGHASHSLEGSKARMYDQQ